MKIKNNLLLILGIGLANVITASSNKTIQTNQDIDEFFIDVPLEEDDLMSFDTSNIPSEYSHIILNKTVNCYAFYEEDLKGATMIIRSVYLRDIKGVAHFFDKKISKKDKYGLTIFKKDGTRKHFTDELESEEFDKEAKKHIRPGDIIRYYYTYDLNRLNSLSYYLSESAPILNCRFIMQSEDKIEYSAKGFNGMSSTMDSTIEDFQILEFKGQNLPIVRDEEHTASNVSMAKIIIGLKYIKQITDNKLFDFNFARQSYGQRYLREINSIEKITIKLYKEIGIKNGDTDEEKAQKIDDYMKEEYKVFEYYFTGLNFNITFSGFFEKKLITPDHAAKYYASFLRMADVEYEIALLADRLDDKFDKKFETWEYFDYLLYYLPSTKKYLNPQNEKLTYGQTPIVAKDNKALYILKHKFGDIETYKTVVRTLKVPGHEENIDSLNIVMDISGTDKKVHFSQTYQGDFAMSFNNAYDDLFFDDKENMFVNSCKLVDKKATPIQEGFKLTSSEEDGFTISGDFIPNGLVGKTQEVKIGALLGKEEVLSPIEKREADFAILPQTKVVNIEITLPNGAKATNLNDFNTTYASDKNAGLAYKITATQDGNKVLISLTEIFENIVYEATEYPEVKGLFDMANSIYTKSLKFQ